MNILAIGGSDPSSGAGIQSDVKTYSSLGAYGFTVITCITSQNSTKFSQVTPVPTKMVKSQIDSIVSDFKIDAIKIGMVYSSSIIKAINFKLRRMVVPIVLDPVFKSTTGGILLQKKALSDFKKLLVPLAFVITPNIYEAEKLGMMTIRKKQDLLKCALRIKKLGAKNVVITGFQSNNKILDFVLENSKQYTIVSKKLANENHGSGCNYSSALVVSTAMGKSLRNSIEFAKKYVYNSIKNSKKIGKGIPITNVNKPDGIEKILRNAISNFIEIKNIHKAIPQCQTNFAYSRIHPKSIQDILGVTGRIVNTGKSVLVAGDLEYGGSRHVGSAILEMSKKFPEIRSAINLKFDQRLLNKFKKIGLKISSYDRAYEPIQVKNKENSSISWGIKKAIQNSKQPPDLVFHTGDWGKEPMILVFGKNPDNVLEKVSSVF